MGPTDALGGLCRFHECALIRGCTIGETAFRHRYAENPPADWFVGQRSQQTHVIVYDGAELPFGISSLGRQRRPMSPTPKLQGLCCGM